MIGASSPRVPNLPSSVLVGCGDPGYAFLETLQGLLDARYVHSGMTILWIAVISPIAAMVSVRHPPQSWLVGHPRTVMVCSSSPRVLSGDPVHAPLESHKGFLDVCLVHAGMTIIFPCRVPLKKNQAFPPARISASRRAACLIGPAPAATGPTHAGQPLVHGQPRISSAAEARRRGREEYNSSDSPSPSARLSKKVTVGEPVSFPRISTATPRSRASHISRSGARLCNACASPPRAV